MHEIDLFGELNKYIEKAVLIINALILFITITKTSQEQKDILSCHHNNQISKLLWIDTSYLRFQKYIADFTILIILISIFPAAVHFF